MELIDYLHVIRRRFLLILVIVLACLGGAAAATKLQTATYQTSARLIVEPATGVSALDEIARRQLATQLSVAYAQIAATGPAISAAVSAAGSQPGASGGSPTVFANATGDDPFISIKVKSTNPRQAAAIANVYPTILPSVLRQLGQAPKIANGSIRVIEPAPIPSSPFSPRPVRNLLIGLVIGLVLGFAAAFVREALDRRLRDSDEVERATGATVLGVVPTEIGDARVPVQTHPMSSRAEAYRKVRTNLTFVGADGMPKSLLITSAVSGEGKTTLATNLALACARTGQRVAIVDADLRRPMVSDYLEVSGTRGLTTVIAGDAELADVLTPIDEGRVDVLASGPIPANPSELLGSARMQHVLDELKRTHDVVIVDAPPVLPVADALVLAVHVEGVVLVTRVGETTRERVRRAKDAVLKVRANLVGVVPNAVVQREDSAYAYAYRYRSRRGGVGDPMTVYSRSARTPEVEIPADDLVPTEAETTTEPDMVGAGTATTPAANPYEFFSAENIDTRRE